MTTGVPLYLVSACATAEEFVAAFRRYADRAGLFVPIADPLPQGRRGRVAVTLTTGGVMIEGEVEVVSSSAKPAPIHGRIGMTLKFVELDEPSRTVLAELEKARLAMKPQPLTVAPRSAVVPAEPRPVAPAPAGRIDAANALAECVLIGDASVLKEAPKSADAVAPGKFVIPTIPSMGGPARPKSPSTPPALTRPKSTTAVPPPTPALGVKATVMGMPPMERTPAAPPAPAVGDKPTTMGMTPLESRPPARPPTPPSMPVVAAKATVMGMAPMERAPAEPPRRDPTPKPTTLGMPVVRAPAHDTEAIVAQQPPRADETSPLLMKSTTPSSLTTTVNSKSPPPPARPKSPSTPPMPRSATPFAPLPIVRKPAGDVVAADDGETTDLTSIPEGPPVGEVQRKTSLGVAMMSAVLEPASADDSGRMHIGPPPKPPEPSPAPGRSGGLRASEIMAAITPSDDWTMTPDAIAPTVLPPEQKLEVPVAAAAAVKPPTPTGDWTISADPSAADGWTAPAKVEVPPEAKQPASGNRVLAVSSSTPLEAVEWEEKPTGIGEPLVQIDPTLMEPLKPMPELDEPAQIVGAPPTDIPPPLGTLFPNATGQNPAVPAPLAFAPPPQFAAPPPQFAAPPPLGPGGSQPFAQQAIPPPLGPMPPRAPSGQNPAMPMGIPTPPPGSIGNFSTTGSNQVIPPGMSQVEVLDLTSRPRPDLTDGNTGFFRDSGEIPRYPTESTDAIDGRSRKRLLVIIMSAVLAVAAVLVVVIFAFGGSSSKPTGTGSNAPLVHADGSARGSSGPGSAAVAMVPPDAAVVAPPPPIVDAGVAAPATCAVEVTSVPTGAEVAIDKNTVLGTTPATLDLPCGVEVKLYIRKAKYGGAIKSFTPSADNSKLLVKLAAPMFSIKVTSVPAGATITVAGKVVGITPTTVKLPAFTTTTITLSKDGFTPDTQKLAPRANNAAHHVSLKKSTIKQKLR